MHEQESYYNNKLPIVFAEFFLKYYFFFEFLDVILARVICGLFCKNLETKSFWNYGNNSSKTLIICSGKSKNFHNDFSFRSISGRISPSVKVPNNRLSEWTTKAIWAPPLLIISIALHAAIYSYYHFHKQYVLPLHCMLQFIIIISLTITYYHFIACCNLLIMYYHWIVGCNLLFIMSCSYPISHPFHWDNC